MSEGVCVYLHSIQKCRSLFSLTIRVFFVSHSIGRHLTMYDNVKLVNACQLMASVIITVISVINTLAILTKHRPWSGPPSHATTANNGPGMLCTSGIRMGQLHRAQCCWFYVCHCLVANKRFAVTWACSKHDQERNR